MPQDIMRLPALTSTAAYQALENHAHDARDWQMRQLFQNDPGRFPRMTVDAAGLFLDYSRTARTTRPSSCWCTWPARAA